MRTLAMLALLAAAAAAQADFSGEWLTDYGMLTFTQNGADVEGSYGNNPLKGKVDGETLTFEYTEGRAKGEGSFTLGKDGLTFEGKWKVHGGRSGNWRGWKKDPAATKGKRAKFSGVWLSSLGTMVLEQKGDQVTGTYGSEGWSTIEGTVKGRRLDFAWKRIRWSGPAWIELTKDGKSFFGRTEERRFTKWLGVRLEGFKRKVKPRAGKTVQGLSSNHMCYFLRAPKRYRPGKKIDALVLLHGSNWTTKGMVWVTGRNWPDIADNFLIIGIQGQNWADWSKPDDLRHNYTYANWMGKSKYKGYPNTDRESPYLVHQVLKELKAQLKIDRIFVAGHSQGGFLTSALVMHYPETFSGALLISCAILMQAEPDVFEDDALMKAQRATPIAVVHGTQDSAVRFSSGEYNHDRFAASEFPMLAFFRKDVGHGYDFLPVGEAVRWAAALSTKDVKELRTFAEARAKKKGWRDVAAALLRARALKTLASFHDLEQQLNDAAAVGALEFKALIAANKDNTWIDAFLLWRADFEFAPAAREAMAAFHKLRDAHDPEAEKLIGEAREAFRARDAETGWSKYEEVMDKYYAARRYRVVKRWLKNRN